MARSKRLSIEVNNNNSLQGLMQEVYNNACNQINDAQKVINELGASAVPDEIDDFAKIAKAKTDALKVKDSAIKIKLDVGKLQSDIIKYGGDIKTVYAENKDIVDKDDFDKIRQLIKNKNSSNKN
jgi:hypothetical protein